MRPCETTGHFYTINNLVHLCLSFRMQHLLSFVRVVPGVSPPDVDICSLGNHNCRGVSFDPIKEDMLVNMRPPFTGYLRFL